MFQETGEALPGSTRSSANSIRLVRGAATPATGYVDQGNGTVRHVPTGLIWKRCAEGQTWNGSTCNGVSFGFSWIDALALAEASTFDGRTDWRLPNMKELRALVDETRTTPPIDPVAFPAAPVIGFWTSTARLDLPGFGWFIQFQNTGGPAWVSLSGEMRVRLVRGGE